MSADPTRVPLLGGAAVLAAAAPTLLAYNVSPSPTFLNQALAFALWGLFALIQAAGQTRPAGPRASAQAWPAQAALALLVGAALWSCTRGGLPAALGVSALGTLAAAALLVHAGAAARADDDGATVFALFAWGWLAAGLLNLGLGLVQVFAPKLPDGDWIAVSNIVGRAVGNLRQPNHLSSVLLWAAIAAVALLELRRLPRVLGWVAFGAMIFGVVLTASRTGLVSVGILALWGLADRRLHKTTRLLLLTAPLIYAVGWFGMVRWAEYSQHTFGGAARLAETDVSGSRFGIWANTVALIKANPWFGVGFGEFNFAWTLTPFPGRPTAFFDHTHNLPLQLAVELGLPLAGLVTLLLLWGLARSAWRAWSADTRNHDDNPAARAAVLFVLMIGLHSLLEYPLWYAYFLLPTAWAFGFALGSPGAPGRRRRGPALLAPAAALLMLGAAHALWDYRQVTVIFSADEGAPPLAQRIERGQRSVYFAHHADYAAATTEIERRLQQHAFDRASHYLLDTRIMMAWAEELAASGDTERARFLADRLREFRNPLSDDWFDECEGEAPQGQVKPFQCKPAEAAHGWREFLPQRGR